MPRELRKRKAPAVEPDTAPVTKKPSNKKGPVATAVAKVIEVAEDVKEAAEEVLVPKAAPKAKANGKPSASKVAVGSTIDLEGFGGEIKTHEGEKTNLKKLLDESKAGVVLFTYPKASTPGCKSPIVTSQIYTYANLHRYETSLSIP
jgi:peroxiredoxin Q/BCP